MGKSSSSPPAAPDPVQTAQAQTQSNEQTAAYQQGLNLINQVTPLGNLTYTMTSPGSGNTPPSYTATTTLTPQEQQSLALQQQVSTALNNLALQGTATAQNVLSTPFNVSNLPQVPTSLDTSGLPAVDLSTLPSAPTSLNLSGVQGLSGIDTSQIAALPGQLNTSNLTPLTGIDQSQISSLPTGLNTSGLGSLSGIDTSQISSLPTGLDLSSLGALPQADEAARQQAQNALYSQQTSMLDPQYAQEQTQLNTQLINSGIPQGSAAYNQAMDNFQRQKQAAYSTAQNDAITGAANYESTLLNNALNVRQEGVSESQQQLSDALGISNAGLTQQQAVASTNLNNQQQQLSTALDQFTSALNASNAGLQQQSTVAGVNLANNNQQLTTQQQALADALNISQAGLQQQQAVSGVNLANAQEGTTQAEDQFSAQTTAQQNALANQIAARNQGLTEAQAQAGQANTANQSAFTEQSYAQNLPINQITALEGAGQIAMPSFGSTPQTGVANTDTAAITQNAYNQQLSIWQQQQQQQQSTLGSIFGGLATIASVLPI